MTEVVSVGLELEMGVDDMADVLAAAARLARWDGPFRGCVLLIYKIKKKRDRRVPSSLEQDKP